MKRYEILISPLVVADGVHVAFRHKYGMVFEYTWYLNDNWFGA